MSPKEIDFEPGTIVSSEWLDALQETLAGLAFNFRLEKHASAAIKVVSNTGNAQSSVVINGKLRYATGTKTRTVSGGAGTYNVFATADTEDRDYDVVLTTDASPAGVTNYRLIGTVPWDGVAISGDVVNLVNGSAPTNSPTFTGTVTVPTPSSGSNTTVAPSTAWVRSRIADVTPSLHRSTHHSGGTDEIDLGSLAGVLVSGQVPVGIIALSMMAAASVGTTQLVDLSVTHGKVASANKDGSAGTASMRTLGSGILQAASGADARFPTAGEKAALVGTSGAPSSSNKFVTKDDPAHRWYTGDLKHSLKSTAPTGWAVCDGSAVARSGTYADLFAEIGTEFGEGNGSTTFNLPDYRGRALYGVGTAAPVDARADNDDLVVGSRRPSHTHAGPAHTHAGPAHTHAGPSHSHTVQSHTHGSGTLVSGNVTSSTSENTSNVDGTSRYRAPALHTHSINGSTGSTNGDTNNSGTGTTSTAGGGDTSSSGTGSTSLDGPSYGCAYIHVKL